jgi:hypothetical protein
MISKQCAALALAVALFTMTGAVAATPPEYCEVLEPPGLEGLCVAGESIPDEAFDEAEPGLNTAAQNIVTKGEKP